MGGKKKFIFHPFIVIAGCGFQPRIFIDYCIAKCRSRPAPIILVAHHSIQIDPTGSNRRHGGQRETPCNFITYLDMRRIGLETNRQTRRKLRPRPHGRTHNRLSSQGQPIVKTLILACQPCPSMALMAEPCGFHHLISCWALAARLKQANPRKNATIL